MNAKRTMQSRWVSLNWACLRFFVVLLGGLSVAILAGAQPYERAPGDLTLFGNPSCQDWPRMDEQQKLVWLRGILGPLNFTYLRSNKDEPDRMGGPDALYRASEAVSKFCEAHQDASAMQGATDHLKALWARKEN